MKPVSLLKTHKTLSNCWSLPDGKFAFFYAFVHENRLLSKRLTLKQELFEASETVVKLTIIYAVA